MKELVLNFWFIVDIGTNICQYFYVRVYHLDGTDSDKTRLLKILAESDYLTCERHPIPENFKVVYPNREVNGIPIHKLNELFEGRMEQFIKIAEAGLPKLLKFDPDGGNHQAIPQRISNNPLFVQTTIFENKYGEQRPFTTDENRQWLEQQRIRFM